MSLADKPAYPVPMVPLFEGGFTEVARPGLTIRQYFAGLAMQGMLSDGSYVDTPSTEIARGAVQMADALIAELEKGE